MFPDQIFPAFVLSGSDVALNIEEASGDNPVTSGEISDLMRQAITDAGKLRVVVST